MKKNTQIIEPNTYYHIYNRGINSDIIFKQTRNYYYFLKLYAKYIPQIADTYAYCLLGNHFHILIRTKSVEEILNHFNAEEVQNLFNVKVKNTITKSASFYISNQFAKLFNSYSQSFNKTYNRTGSLFEHPFRRIPVMNEQYFTSLIYYIHANPQNHGICNDFTEYTFSSFNAFLLEKKTQLKRNDVLEWFGSKEQFIRFHKENTTLFHKSEECRNLFEHD